MDEPQTQTLQSDSAGSADPEIIWPPPPPADPWAHRRGEPRIFTLLWIGWLMLITSVSFAAIGPRGIVDPDEARPSTRILLMLLLCGAAFLWPAFRLCQIRPRRIVSSVLLDLVVICVPAQIVIWPQVLLAYWPIPILASVATLLATWSTLTAAVLIFAYSTESVRHPLAESPSRSSRAIWMVTIILAALFAPVLSLLVPGHEDPVRSISDGSAFKSLSPLTGVYELTADRFWSGSSAAVLPSHWSALGWLAAGSSGLLIIAIAQAWFTVPRHTTPGSMHPDEPRSA